MADHYEEDDRIKELGDKAQFDEDTAEKLKSEGYWRTLYGDVLHVSQMTDKHLLGCREWCDKNPGARDWAIEHLDEEIEKRGLQEEKEDEA